MKQKLMVLNILLSMLMLLPGCEQEGSTNEPIKPQSESFPGTTLPTPTQTAHTATGTVTAIVPDPQAAEISIAHDPIPGLNMPSMTMSFAIDASLLNNVKIGDKVTFVLTESDGGYVIQAIRRQ